MKTYTICLIPAILALAFTACPQADDPGNGLPPVYKPMEAVTFTVADKAYPLAFTEGEAAQLNFIWNEDFQNNIGVVTVTGKDNKDAFKTNGTALVINLDAAGVVEITSQDIEALQVKFASALS
jgi:hypothetical protein